MKLDKTYTYGKQNISWKDIWEVVKVLRSPFLTQGPKIFEFEKVICDCTGAKYSVVVSNATAALHIAMKALGISEGDEVITSPNTFLASANAVIYVGGAVKFADIDSRTACIDTAEIKKHITKQTKVIIPVHYAGQSCDMEKIQKIAKEHNLFIVEDAAHAIGSEYKNNKVGCCQFSDMTVFSFHPVKNLTTGEGGVITTNNKDLYEKLLKLRSHGIVRDKNSLINNDGSWYYEMPEPGFNYRMTDIQAALGISQFKRLDKFVNRRREIVNFYKDAFDNDERFSFLQEMDDSKAAFHLFPLLIDFSKVKIIKKELFEKLKESGLNLQVHYIPVHLQPFYSNFGFKKGDFPKAEKFYQNEVSLPLYYGLNQKDLNYIVDVIKKVVK